MTRYSWLKTIFIVALLSEILVAVAPGLVKAEDSRPAIEYVYPDQSVWTSRVDADGVLANPLHPFVETLLSRMQLAWSARAYPAERLFRRLEHGESNFSILVKAPRLMESCIFSKTPVTFTELRVYRKTKSPAVIAKEGLKRKSVIAILGYSYGNIAQYLSEPDNGIEVHSAKTHDSAFQMLTHGRAEYLLDYSGPSDEILAWRPHDHVVHDVLERLDVYLVLSKNYPDAEQMMENMETVPATIDVSQWGLPRPEAERGSNNQQ